MLANLWSFLQDESNRAVLAWIGGGAVVVAGGIWTVFKFMASDRGSKRRSERSAALKLSQIDYERPPGAGALAASLVTSSARGRPPREDAGTLPLP